MAANDSMTPLEERQIKGLTAKSLWLIISSTAVVVATVLLSVSGINESISEVHNQLQLLQKDRENDRIFYEYKFNEIQRRLDQQQQTIEMHNKKIEELQKDILKTY